MKTLDGMKVRKAGEIKFLTEEFLSTPTYNGQKKLENALDVYRTIERGITERNESHTRLFPNGTPTEQRKKQEEVCEEVTTAV